MQYFVISVESLGELQKECESKREYNMDMTLIAILLNGVSAYLHIFRKGIAWVGYFNLFIILLMMGVFYGS